MQEKSFGQSASCKVLVYGWYNKNNVGDDLFCHAFKKIFPYLNFEFTDNLNMNNLKEASTVFIGGGSFLFADPLLSEECLKLLKTKTILYIGVGVETEIHPIHKDLIKLAALVATRSTAGLDNIKNLNDNIIVIPDIVYSLNSKLKVNKINKSILIIPNICTIPKNTDPHWKHNSWNNFKFEFSQFLDNLIESKYKIDFLSMCRNNDSNDDNAAYEIINAMNNRDNYLLDFKSEDPNKIIELFKKYDVVITQRYHGIILSELANVPFISIHHHDKLKRSLLNNGIFISYYGFHKQGFIDQFNLIKEIQKSIAIESNIFDTLKEKVKSIIER